VSGTFKVTFAESAHRTGPPPPLNFSVVARRRARKDIVVSPLPIGPPNEPKPTTSALSSLTNVALWDDFFTVRCCRIDLPRPCAKGAFIKGNNEALHPPNLGVHGLVRTGAKLHTKQCSLHQSGPDRSRGSSFLTNF